MQHPMNPKAAFPPIRPGFRRIVLHLGPAKCGTTSIQKPALKGYKSGGTRLSAVPLNPEHLKKKLNDEDADLPTLDQLRSKISMKIKNENPDVLVLTHESIFTTQNALRHISHLSSEFTNDVCAVAYVRRQSDYMVSSFGQWYFRHKGVMSRARNALIEHNFDPDLFLAVEIHLIASILGGWGLSGHDYLNWRESIQIRRNILEALGVPLSIGVVPNASFPFNLFEDFVYRCGFHDAVNIPEAKIENASFDPAAIEAIALAVLAGYSMPGPHGHKEFCASLFKGEMAKPKLDLSFLDFIKDRVDTIFEAENMYLAEREGLPALYFAPRNKISNEEFLEVLHQEASRRTTVPQEMRDNQRRSMADVARRAWQQHLASLQARL